MAYMHMNNINKFYPVGKTGEFQALNDVNLSFDKGEVVAIVGESGSGKSTMMNLIGGLDSDYTGDMIVAGQYVNKFSEKQLVEYRKRKIGFVFQSFNLISHLSVLDNVMMAMTLSNVPKKIRVDIATKTLADIGLLDQIHKKPNTLSGGQKQRVAIARALVNDPDIIIADEPTGALDSETADSVISLIRDIAKKDKLVIIVTHSERVAQNCDRIVNIFDGKITNARQEDLNKDFKVEKIEKYSDRNLSFIEAVRLSLLNMWEKRGRNLLVSIGGSIGITSVILMLALGLGINDYLKATIGEQVNPLVAEAQLKVERDASAPPIDNSPFGEIQNVDYFGDDDFEKLSKINNVKSIEKGYNNFGVGYFSFTYKEEVKSFMMINTVAPTLTSSDLYKGEFPKNGEVMLSRNLYESYDTEMLNETIDVNVLINGVKVDFQAVIVGVLNSDDVNPTSMFTSLYTDYDYLLSKSQEDEAQFGATSLFLIANDESNTEAIKSEINAAGFSGSNQESLIGVFDELLSVFTVVLAGVAGISLIVSAIMILTVLFISVVERTNEIGVLKAIGARRKDIQRIFVSEAFLIGLFSGLIGMLSAAILTYLINSLSNSLFDVNVLNLAFKYLLGGMLLSVSISVVAGLIPSSRASKLDPVESLRQD